MRRYNVSIVPIDQLKADFNTAYKRAENSARENGDSLDKLKNILEMVEEMPVPFSHVGSTGPNLAIVTFMRMMDDVTHQLSEYARGKLSIEDLTTLCYFSACGTVF